MKLISSSGRGGGGGGALLLGLTKSIYYALFKMAADLHF